MPRRLALPVSLCLAAIAPGFCGCATPQAESAAAASAAPVTATPLAPSRAGPAQPAPPAAAPRPVVATVPPQLPPTAQQLGRSATGPVTPYPQYWDGNYQGRSELVQAGVPFCPPSRYGVYEVGDSTLFLAYAPDTLFTTPVQPDGIIDGMAGVSHLTGRIAGGVLMATVKTPTCETRYHASYVWNHSYPR